MSKAVNDGMETAFHIHLVVPTQDKLGVRLIVLPLPLCVLPIMLSLLTIYQ